MASPDVDVYRALSRAFLVAEQVSEGDVYTILNPKSADSDFGANPVVFDFDGGKYVAAGQKSGGLYVFDRTTGHRISERQFGNGTTYIGGIFQALARRASSSRSSPEAPRAPSACRPRARPCRRSCRIW